MKRNRLSITFLLSIFVVISFMPTHDFRSEAFETGDAKPGHQWVYLLDNDNLDAHESNAAVLNGSLNFEGKKFLDFSTLLSWNHNSATPPLYFLHISQTIESRFLLANLERSPRAPPSASL